MRRQAEEILERDEVGAAAERGQVHLEAVLPAPAPLGRLALPLGGAPLVVDRALAIVVRHVARHLHEEVAQRRRAAAIEASAHRQVGVDVDDGLLAQLFLQRLGVLGGADQPELLGIPEREDDRALRGPSRSGERRQAARDFERRAEAGARVHATEAPRIVMRAQHNPAIGIAAGDLADDVANGPAPGVHLHVELYRHRPGAQVIRERQGALEAGARGNHGPAQLRQDLRRLAPRQHHGGDLRQGRCRCRVERRRIGRRADAGRERIAVPEPAVLAVAALRLEVRAPWPVRPRRSAREPIVGRIRIDDDAGSAGLLRGVELHRAMTAGVARDDDLAAHVDAGRGEPRVVGRQTVVRVDHRAGHGAGRGIGHERRTELGVGAIGIPRQDRLAHGQRRGLGRHDVDLDRAWGRKLDEVLADLGLQARLIQRLSHAFRHLHRPWRAGDVRVLGDLLVNGADRLGRHAVQETLLHRLHRGRARGRSRGERGRSRRGSRRRLRRLARRRSAAATARDAPRRAGWSGWPARPRDPRRTRRRCSDCDRSAGSCCSIPPAGSGGRRGTDSRSRPDRSSPRSARPASAATARSCPCDSALGGCRRPARAPCHRVARPPSVPVKSVSRAVD